VLGIDKRAARWIWTALLILLLCAIVYTIRRTLFVFIIALLFAYLLLPLVDFMDRALPMHRSRTPALAIVYVCLVAMLILTGIEVGTTVAEQANNLVQKVSDFLKPEEKRELPLPQPMRPMGQRIVSAVRQQIQQHSQELVASLPKAGLKIVSLAGYLIFVIIVPILSFFFLKDGRALQKHFLEYIEDESDRMTVTEIATDLNVLLAQYMRALVLLGLAVFVTYSIFFSIMGVPFGILLAAISFPLEFIPMIGPLVSATLIVLVSGLAGFHSVIYLVIFLALYRMFQDYVLAPHLMSAGMELHPLLVLFGVFAGEQLGGVAGTFLSVPVMATLRIVYKRLQRARLAKPAAPEPVVVPLEEVLPNK